MLDAWRGGEDYELLMTVPSETAEAALAISRRIGVSLTSIGEIRGADEEVVVDGLADTEPDSGYDHFA